MQTATCATSRCSALSEPQRKKSLPFSVTLVRCSTVLAVIALPAGARELFVMLTVRPPAYADNTGVFRDIKQQGSRTVVSEEDVGAGTR